MMRVAMVTSAPEPAVRTDQDDEGPAAPPTGRPSLHRWPPATPSSFYASRRPVLVVVGILFLLVAGAAAIHNGWLLLRWDLPIQRFVERHRTDELTTFFRGASRLGSTAVVVAVSAAFTVLTWRRCRAVGIAILVAAVARPLLEFVLKLVVARDRPDLEQLVNGRGFSFPSGHVMAAVALYGLVPLVVALFTRSRALWWASVAASGLVIGAIAASRVYLGVHWFSDVVGSLLLGSFFLLGVEAALDHAHRVDGCRVTGGAAANARAEGATAEGQIRP
jgi:undecaprenyl-diphosphatase